MNFNVIYNEDCIEGAKHHIHDGSIDLIITDPPYGIDGAHLDKHYNRNENYVVDGYIDVPKADYGIFSEKWISECARILRPGGSVYIVSGYTNLHHILNALHSTELEEINHIIWKYNFGVYTRNKFVSSHYHILFWQKPGGVPTFNTFCRFGDSEKSENGSSLNYADREDVFVIDREYQPGEIKNKNELPFALLSKMILYSSNPGDVVCDMFLGGGSTAIVSKGLNRKYVGFELSKNAFELASSRIVQTNEGSMIDLLRIPSKNMKENSGKSWTDEERTILITLYKENQNLCKKDAIENICKQLQRGRWGVENELKRLGVLKKTKSSRNKKNTESRDDNKYNNSPTFQMKLPISDNNG